VEMYEKYMLFSILSVAVTSSMCW